MAAAYTLIGKTCRALQCFIRAGNVAGLPSQNVRAHKESESKSFPAVLVRSTGAVPMVGNPGRWTVSVEIAVATQMLRHPDDEQTNLIEQSDELAGSVFDLFFDPITSSDTTPLAEAITAAAHAAVYTGDDQDLILAAAPFASLAQFTCDAVMFPSGIDLQENAEGNAYVDILPLQLHVRSYPAP